MRTKRLITCIATVLTMTLLLAACGNTASTDGTASAGTESAGSSSTSKNTPTLSEYTAKDGAILYVDFISLKKDTKPTVCVFTDGMLYLADSYDFATLAGMADDEIISAVKSSSDGYDYVWSIETDDDGVTTYYEKLYYIAYGSLECAVRDVRPNEISSAISGSYYYGYQGTSHYTIVVRCEEGEIPFVFDTPDSDGVFVDKTFPEIVEELGVN